MCSENEQRMENIQFESLIQGLINQKYGSCINFISPSTILGLRNNIAALSAEGHLKFAGIGNKKLSRQDKLIRSDTINWIEEKTANPFEKIYLDKIERLIQYLNKTCFTSLKTFECHYANFEKGSFYKKHFDQFKNEHGRKYSVVLYLNDDWKTEDEGMLSLYLSDSEQKDISPIEGRLVFFESDVMEHEVHPSFTRDRKSIAGWLKD